MLSRQKFEPLTPTGRVKRATDATITAAIERLFLTQKGVAPHHMVVAVRQGIVELTGSVNNMSARRRAREIAMAVRGVRGVINEVSVCAGEVLDTELERDVARALAVNPATKNHGVCCTVANGAATLTGTVRCRAEKELVLYVVGGVRGIRTIEATQLHIRGAKLRNSDEVMTAQLRELLAWNIRLAGDLVQVHVKEQVVYLSGAVGTAADRTCVVATAYQVGASFVNADDLEVTDWALDRDLRRNKVGRWADEDIASAVRDAFRYDPRVLFSKLRVRVRDGVALLMGVVGSVRARCSAEQDARNVVGIWKVRNLLVVNPRRFFWDGTIRRTIVKALANDPHVGRFEFNVNVRHGRVYLYGRVSSHFEVQRVGETAAAVKGVVEVDNQAEVFSPNGLPRRPYHRAPAGSIRQQISMQTAFWSRGCCLLHGQNVEVRATVAE